MANELGAAPQGLDPRGWEQLPRGLVQRVFQQLGPADYLNAGQVCPAWFGAAMEDPAVTQLPVLLFLSHLPGETVRFHSLSDSRLYELAIDGLDPVTCRGATSGWLLFEGAGGVVRVFNMLRRKHFDMRTHKTGNMPPLRHLASCTNTPAQRRNRYPELTVGILSSAPSEPRCAFAGVVGKKRLVMCRLADLTWVFVADCDSDAGYVDLAHYGGCFYALGADNNLTLFDAAPTPNVRRIMAGASSAGYGPPAVYKYLVESLGELLLVENTLDLRAGAGPVAVPSNCVRIFKLDKRRPRWIPVLVDVEWSCSDTPPAEAEEENSERSERDEAGDDDSDGEAMPAEDVEVDRTVRRRLLVLGRGTSRSLASDGFPDVTLDPFNREVMYTLSDGETTLILPKRGCDRCNQPIWVTPNPKP